MSQDTSSKYGPYRSFGGGRAVLELQQIQSELLLWYGSGASLSESVICPGVGLISKNSKRILVVVRTTANVYPMGYG